MDNYTQTLILLDQSDFTPEQRVQLFELTLSKVDIDTIQGMADKTGLTYNGVKMSKRFKKKMVGCQKMAISGVKQDNMPF